jgi:hypothetical protein
MQVPFDFAQGRLSALVAAATRAQDDCFVFVANFGDGTLAQLFPQVRAHEIEEDD